MTPSAMRTAPYIRNQCLLSYWWMDDRFGREAANNGNSRAADRLGTVGKAYRASQVHAGAGMAQVLW
jgi:hypothetical protein